MMLLVLMMKAMMKIMIETLIKGKIVVKKKTERVFTHIQMYLTPS